MVNMDRITKKYYIKKDGIVNEVTENEYKLFKEKMEELKKFYLCPHCKVCTCEKIKYSDINVCKEVNIGAYKLLNGIYTNKLSGKYMRRKEVDEFEVYDCDMFELYSNLVKDSNNNIRTKTCSEKQLEKEKMQEKQVIKMSENKEILEKLRNRAKEEEAMKLSYQLNN